jgi:hypothetical protein
MQTKMFEVRDEATFIPVVAVLMVPDLLMDPPAKCEAQRYLLRRVGYPMDRPQVVLFRASGGGHAYSDPYDWPNRTMQVAHLYILEHFDRLTDGDVVDVQFIIGETKAPKVSERVSVPL